MAKKKPATGKQKKQATKKQTPAAGRKVNEFLDDVPIILAASFIKISSTSLDFENNLTITAYFRAPAGTPVAVNVSYFNTDTGETGSVLGVINGRQATATINLPDDGVYYIQVTLRDTSTNPATTLATDSTIVDTDNIIIIEPNP